jgi:hypothetical protein
MTGACALGAPGGRAVGVGVSAGRRAAPALPAPAPQALGVLYHTGREARCKDDTPESKRPSPQPRAALESYGEALRQSLGGKQPGAGRGRRPTGRAGRPPEGAPSGLRVPARFDSLAPQQRARSGKRPSTPRRGLVQEGRAGRYCKIREGAGRRSNLKARRLAGPAGPGRSARRRQRGWGWHQHRGKRAVLTARAAPQLRARADCWGKQRRPACHNSPRLQAARRRAASMAATASATAATADAVAFIPGPWPVRQKAGRRSSWRLAEKQRGARRKRSHALAPKPRVGCAHAPKSGHAPWSLAAPQATRSRRRLRRRAAAPPDGQGLLLAPKTVHAGAGTWPPARKSLRFISLLSAKREHDAAAAAWRSGPAGARAKRGRSGGVVHVQSLRHSGGRHRGGGLTVPLGPRPATGRRPSAPHRQYGGSMCIQSNTWGKGAVGGGGGPG